MVSLIGEDDKWPVFADLYEKKYKSKGLMYRRRGWNDLTDVKVQYARVYNFVRVDKKNVARNTVAKM